MKAHPNIVRHWIEDGMLVVEVNVQHDPEAPDYNRQLMHEIIRCAMQYMKQKKVEDLEFRRAAVH